MSTPTPPTTTSNHQPPPTPLVACVGKPSAGKSSLLNSLVAQNIAKTGNYPFTTIDPNYGVAYARFPCPCTKFHVSELCKPRYGSCEEGQRLLPVRILDVAGLVPGAHEGKGLGNKFLDDLRTADCLVHVVDVSGTTDANGKETVGYDPIEDIDWLRSEIREWIWGNLKEKWSGVVRRHVMSRTSAAEGLLGMWSGYGADLKVVQATLGRLSKRVAGQGQARGESLSSSTATSTGSTASLAPLSANFQVDHLETWTEPDLRIAVDCFLDERFPTVIALNKIDLATPDTDKNIDRICRRYGQDSIVLTSALAEFFLRKLDKQKFIKYKEGDDSFETSETAHDPDSGLQPLDDKTRNRLKNVQDLVLFRYGGTGVGKILSLAVSKLGMQPVYIVGNIHYFSAPNSTPSQGVFRDAILVPPLTTVKSLARTVLRKGEEEIDKVLEYAVTSAGVRWGPDQVVNEPGKPASEPVVLSFKLRF